MSAPKLLDALPQLVSEGLITAEQAERIRARYASDAAQGTGRMLLVFAILGSLLVGLGIMLIVAHNWDDFSRPVRTVLAIAPVLIGQALVWHALRAKPDVRAWREGSAVFLGRAADLILPRTTGLRVRLVAPLDMRIQSYARVHGLSQEQARTEIETVEAERRAFVHKHFGVDVADPVRSDLVINTGYFSHLQAVEMILAARHTRLH